MPYSPQTWADGPNGTPVSAARLTVMESGIASSAQLSGTNTFAGQQGFNGPAFFSSGIVWYDPAAIAWRDYGVDITNGANSTQAKAAWATAIAAAFASPLGGIRSEGIHAVDGLMIDAYAALGAQATSGTPYGYRFPRIEAAGAGGLVFQQPAGGTADILTIRGALSTNAGPAHNNKVVWPLLDGIEFHGVSKIGRAHV